MRVGILGGGQLGRMMVLAGVPLGLRFRALDPSPLAPIGHIAELQNGDFEAIPLLERFVDGLDVVTYEFENVPVEAVRWLSEQVPIYPGPQALETAQDRLIEKRFFQSLGIATPPFQPVDSEEDLWEAIASLGLPAVLKTRRMGYDGKGQIMLREPREAAYSRQVLGDVPQILEGYVSFERELSILAIRGRDGQCGFFPLVENHHREGMLRWSLAPAHDPGGMLQAQAESHARGVLKALDYVGLLAIEFFEVEGQLLANEMAPRVHNSGHWSIEGAKCSQFEMHLRAICGWPLGETTPIGYSAMINLIGATPRQNEILGIPGVHLHLYGKTPAPGRKLGHLTLRADTAEELSHLLDVVEERGFPGTWDETLQRVHGL